MIRRSHLPARLLVSIGLGLVVVCAGASSVLAVEQGGLGGKPARPRADNPRSQSIFVHELAAGKQTTDAVEVINGTPETKHVLVYAVDSQVSSGGAFACAQAADKPISVGTWVGLDKKELTLAPAEKQTVQFTINVPANASPGEHNGCIVIQDTKQQRAPDSNGIVLSMRSAIRLAVTVPGEIHKALVFTGVGIQSKDDKKILLSTGLRNSGNVSLDTQLTIALRYPLGTTAAEAGGNFPVLSSSEARFNFEGKRPFWGGWYRLLATARYNDNPKTSVGEGASNVSATYSKWIFVTPQPIAAALEGALLVVLAGGITLLVRRYMAHRRVKRDGTTHRVVTGEDLHTIAEHYDMSWKLLARINKLKPPYRLRAGQTLHVAATPKKTVHKRVRPGTGV